MSIYVSVYVQQLSNGYHHLFNLMQYDQLLMRQIFSRMESIFLFSKTSIYLKVEPEDETLASKANIRGLYGHADDDYDILHRVNQVHLHVFQESSTVQQQPNNLHGLVRFLKVLEKLHIFLIAKLLSLFFLNITSINFIMLVLEK